MLWACGATVLPAVHASAPNPTLVAAWQSRDDQHIGLLSVSENTWSVQRSLKVPTRAHGLWHEADGQVLAVARRPGDWLLRWDPVSGRTQWHWIDGDRRFNGHVITLGQTLWTTEIDLDSAQGLLGVRDARTLEKTDEWPTQGMDPHQLLALPVPVGDYPAGTLMVANGGIPTLPETGRSKRQLGRMDASLVALHPTNGEILGQWRLADPYLSIRHLAWDANTRTLGIALQAEHPDASLRTAAPVLAVWNGQALRAAHGQPAVAGYGGDICALPGGGFAVSCPRVNALVLFDAQGGWYKSIAHPQAYALAANADRWWLASGRSVDGILQGQPSGEALARSPDGWADTQIDNHWVLVKT